MHEDIHITIFADDTTLYTSTKSNDNVIESLEQTSLSLFK